MRRISLAVALVGAMAAAGCGGGANSSGAGSAKGVKDGYFTVTVQNTAPLAIKNGKVTSAPTGIDCGGTATACTATFPLGTQVVLTGAPTTGNVLLYWAGDCAGADVCTLSGNADKYVVVQFGLVTDRTGHPNFTDPTVHVPAFLSRNNATGYVCTSCHGTNLAGQSIAPSCGACHSWPLPMQNPTNFDASTVGAHFDPTLDPWGTHSGQNWSQACQRCHTDQGFRDFVGALAAPGETTASDDHLTGVVGAPAQSTNTLTTDTATGAYTHGPLKCQTCHNPVSNPVNSAGTLSGIKFPSTLQVTADAATTLCAQCHQARESSASVDAYVAGGATADTVLSLSFKNGHYLGAGATLFGSEAAGWAQYKVRGGTASYVYTARNEHGGVASCTYCHDAHTGQLPADRDIAAKCGKCHYNDAGAPVSSFLELEETRQYGFEGDIDGNGVQESIKKEIDGLGAKLYDAIQAYATNISSQGVCYSTTYPYFFKHTGTGACTTAEQVSTNAFKAFTPALMRAAYNYNWYQREPGAWAHNPRYVVEVLFDAISDLNVGLGTNAVPFSGLRSFNGHFGGADSADKYAQFLYDATAPALVGTGFTSPDCNQCHGGKAGFAQYLASPFGAVTPTVTWTKYYVTGMQCATCHDISAGKDMKSIRGDVATLYFPPQKDASAASASNQIPATTFAANTVFQNPQDRVCATCHTARESKASVDATFVGKTGWSISFKNPHYLGAAGVMFGSNAHMMYEYTGKTYAAYPAFFQADMTKQNGPHGSPHAQRCTSCHNPWGTRHSFEVDTATTVPAGTYGGAVNTEACDQCHVVKSYGDFRLPPLKANVKALSDLLYTTIQSYTATAAADQTTNPGAKPACYSDKYPYWYDATATSNCTTNLVSANGAKFDQAGAKAAFNYKWSVAEPGAYAHNYEYMVQALIDSIQDLNPAAVLPIDAKTNATIVRP